MPPVHKRLHIHLDTTTRDFPVLQGVVLIAAISVFLVNLLVDVLYALVDPRIRYR
jgi:ABC-type dipeptide/oligopeptide/nickel transport system permease component